MNDNYLNYIIQPYKIAANYSLEKMDFHIANITMKLESINKINPEFMTQEQLRDKQKCETILSSIYLAYIFKDSGILYVSPPDGMNWLLNCNLTA